jgi:hypothetical protein
MIQRSHCAASPKLWSPLMTFSMEEVYILIATLTLLVVKN